MQTIKFIFVFGVLVILAPFLGVPVFWKNIFLSVVGFFVCALSYSLMRQKIGTEKTVSTRPFSSRLEDIQNKDQEPA